MEEKELTHYQYIETYLQFTTYKDFCSNCKAIKCYYSRFDREGKQFYKWYVYASNFLNENQKNSIWNYLNSEEPDCVEKLLHPNRKGS